MNLKNILIYKVISRIIIPILKLFISSIVDTFDYNISIIIFSKNRPLQLDACIKSCNYYIDGYKEITVIFNYSNEFYKKAMLDVVHTNEVSKFVDQNDFTDFHKCLSLTLKNIKSNRVIFLVDDIILTDHISILDFSKINLKNYIPSLRLGKNIIYSYGFEKNIKQPKFKIYNKFLTWNSKGSEYDFNYPFSLDGNMYLKNEIIFLIKYIYFINPNDFEGKMQVYKPYFATKIGLCYETSKLFNIPCNTVIENNTNKFGEVNTDLLLKLWVDGKRIDFLYYSCINNKSVHQDVELKIL